MTERSCRRARVPCAALFWAAFCIAGFAASAHADWIDVRTGTPVVSWPVLVNDDSDLSKGVHHVRPDPSDRRRAYDPQTGRNFALNRCGDWIDVRTGKPVASWPVLPNNYGDPTKGVHHVRPGAADRRRAYDPQTGRNFVHRECPPASARTSPPTEPAPRASIRFEPKFSIGAGGAQGRATYTSTGAQAPFSGGWSQGDLRFCGGATLWPGLELGPARVGLDLNLCSGGSAFGDGASLFAINRHGPGGDVGLRSATNFVFDLQAKLEVPLDQAGDWAITTGAGPSLRQISMTLVSRQGLFGGGTPVAHGTDTQLGIGASIGIVRTLCTVCFMDQPLRLGLEGRARYFPSRSIGLRSPAFGFTETGRTGGVADYSVMVVMSVPFGGAE